MGGVVTGLVLDRRRRPPRAADRPSEPTLEQVAGLLGATVEEVVAFRDRSRADPAHRTLLELYAAIEPDRPDWVRDKDEATRRLLYGEPAAEHRLGRLLPAVPGCGDIPYLSLSQARLERLVADTRRRVAKQRRWDARSAGRRSAGPEKNLGAGAARNLVEVVRWVCGTLGADPAIRWNPAADLHAPGRRQHVPGFGADELVRIRGCLRQCRRDPDLDELVLDFALATGARKTAMIGLRVGDLSLSRCAVRLYRKGGGTYWVPVRRSLLLDVLTHARARGARSLDDPALLRRPRGGRPQQLTARYFDRLWDVVAAELVDAPVRPTTHRLRHTAIDRVFEGAGLKAAASFAGHTPGRFRLGGVTVSYLDPLPEPRLRHKLAKVFGPFEDIEMPPATALPPWP